MATLRKIFSLKSVRQFMAHQTDSKRAGFRDHVSTVILPELVMRFVLVLGVYPRFCPDFGSPRFPDFFPRFLNKFFLICYEPPIWVVCNRMMFITATVTSNLSIALQLLRFLHMFSFKSGFTIEPCDRYGSSRA